MIIMIFYFVFVLVSFSHTALVFVTLCVCVFLHNNNSSSNNNNKNKNNLRRLCARMSDNESHSKKTQKVLGVEAAGAEAPEARPRLAAKGGDGKSRA